MKSFLKACGIKDSLRLSVEGPEFKGGESRWTFPQPFAVIGRDPRVDVHLEDQQVSRRHVYLQGVAGWLFWVNLESRVGTRTEAGRQKFGWMMGDDSLCVGPYKIRRGGPTQAGESASSRPPRELPSVAMSYGRDPLPEVTLEFLNGPSKATRWPMHRVLSMIGSAKGCKFRLPDRSVSAFHASLLRTPTGLWVVDLRGDQRISVNAVPVRASELVDGDVLDVGRYRIRVQIRERGEGLDGGGSDPALERSAGGLAWQVGGGREQAALPFGGRAAGAIMAARRPGMPLGQELSLPNSQAASASGMEIVGSDAAFAGTMPQPEISHSVLVPLVNQFSLMQQQMFDQFQQAMGMLVQMFGTMHREQMEVIREELDRLHQLSKELQELKDELASSPRRSPPRADDVVAENGEVSAESVVTPIDRPTAVTPPSVAPPTRPQSSVVPPQPSKPAWPPPPIITPPSTTAAAPGSQAAPAAQELRGFEGSAPLRPPPLRSDSPVVPRTDQPRPGTVSSPITPEGTGSANPEQDAVAWIHQRIMTIQRERETRWQKILKLLPGAS